MADGKIEAIRDAYRKRFDQENLSAEVDSPVRTRAFAKALPQCRRSGRVAKADAWVQLARSSSALVGQRGGEKGHYARSLRRVRFLPRTRENSTSLGWSGDESMGPRGPVARATSMISKRCLIESLFGEVKEVKRIALRVKRTGWRFAFRN